MIRTSVSLCVVWILSLFFSLTAAKAQVETITIAPGGQTIVVYPHGAGIEGSVAYGDGLNNLINLSGGKDPSDLTGRYNTCGGLRCGTHMTTGSYNTAFGYEALEFTTTGTGNTSVGEAAMIYNITGSGNVALGLKAGHSKQGTGLGNYNVFIGHHAGLQSSGNNENVVIGSYAASKPNFTGDQNVLIGHNAGHVITTGTRNTCIGSDACLTLTTGSNNTFIGPCSDVPPTISNKVMICDGTGAIVWQSP